jgi:hypothetical protein
MNMNLKGRTKLLDISNCNDLYSEGSLVGKVLVIAPGHVTENFKPPFQTPENQLFVALGGFGCEPYTSGRAIVGTFLNDGESCRFNVGDFSGELKPELIEEFELQELIEKYREEE